MERVSTPNQHAKFTSGSIVRHVFVMTATASVGLLATFAVDMLNLLYISHLGVPEFTAALGFASTLLFFALSISLGLTVPVTALIGHCLGSGDRQKAAETGGACMVYVGLVTVAFTLAIWPFLGSLLFMLGARGDTLDLARGFLNIVMPSIPLAGLGMCATGILRGVGDARLAMYVTLFSAVAAAILDPIFIFAFDLGLNGAAITTVLSRAVMLLIGWYGAHRVHGLVALPARRRLKAAAVPFFEIAVPAILAQFATPVGNAYLLAVLARSGDGAVVGMAVISRLVPFVFVGLFALSGAVGPIFAQNLSAQEHGRILETIRGSLVLSGIYVLVVWTLLAIFAHPIADLFEAEAMAREVILFFCWFVAGTYFFTAAIIVASAAFNNLGRPRLSTLLNWGRSTIGVFPFVSTGAAYYGANGALAGSAIGVALFGIIAIAWCHRVVNQMMGKGLVYPTTALGS